MAPPAPVVGVSLQHDGFAPGGTAERARCLHLEFRIRGHVVIAVLSLAVLIGIGTPPADAQSDPVPWGGTVEVRGGPLSVKAGESVTYFLRLSEPPTADGWWVRVHVDGVVWGDVGYKGLSWVPSVGWGFDQDDWDVWRGITIRAADDAKLNTQVTFTHEVWDHTAECPVHNVGSVTVQITENPTVIPLPTLEIDDVTVSEGGGSAVFRVRLIGQSPETVTVEYETLDGTASAGSDYTTKNGTLRFLANETSKTIEVAVLDDIDVEGEETFRVTLTDPQNATLLDDVGIARIRDDEGVEPPQPGVPTLAINDVTVSEGDGSAVFSVILRGQSTGTVTVPYETSNGSAIADSDYTATSGTLLFQPGEQAKTIAVEVVDDSAAEGDEKFTVSLSDPPNATLLKGVGTATIVDNDGTDLPTLSISGVTVTEGSGSAVFRVGLNKQSGDVVTVVYATSDGTATAGADYAATGGTLTFEPGETRQTISVEVLDDDEVEGDETFTVRLSNARNATLGVQEATGTIRDDESDGGRPPGLPELVIYDVTVAEDAGSAVFRVGLSAESDQAVTVAYRTSDWTATAGADYAATNGTLVFQPGETRKVITVPVLDDSEEEGTETFTVRLSDVGNATLVDRRGRGRSGTMTLTMMTPTMAPMVPLPAPGCRRWSSTT